MITEAITQYVVFLAETITFVAAFAFIILLIASTAMRNRDRKDRVSIKKVNEHFDELKELAYEAILDKNELKKHHKDEKKRRKEKSRDKENPQRPRTFVLTFDGDTAASQVENLREEITTVLTVAREEDEVLVRLESPGGEVHGYGLCASQLSRIRDKKIPLTVCVDKVAASGGYLMACLANKIVAAPFAIIGSIGVLLQLPNFNRLLKKHNVDYEMITAGEFKRTLTMLGENSDKARKKVQEEVDDTHQLFKNFVSTSRPTLDIDQVATGEFWYGQRALDLKLIDELGTSDDYLLAISETNDIFEVEYIVKPSLKERLSEVAESSVFRIWNRIFSADRSNFPG